MVNNGTMSYDHDRDGTHTELAGCESQFRNAKEDTYVAIRYERKRLTVRAKVLNNSVMFLVMTSNMLLFDRCRLTSKERTHGRSVLKLTESDFRPDISSERLLPLATSQVGREKTSQVNQTRIQCFDLLIVDNHDIISMKLYDISVAPVRQSSLLIFLKCFKFL